MYANVLNNLFKYMSKKTKCNTTLITVKDLISIFDVGEYISILEESYSEIYKNNIIKIVRMFFDYLFETGQIDVRFDFPSVKGVHNPDKYNEDIYREMIIKADFISSHLEKYASGRNCLRDKVVFVLIYEIGLKLSECKDLIISDIEINEGRIRINRKKKTTIYFSEKCKEYIEEYYALRRLDGFKPMDPFIVNLKKTTISNRSIQDIIYKIVKDIDDRLNANTLRLLCGAKMYMQTGDLAYVSQFLGIRYDTAEGYYMCIKHIQRKI